MNAVVGYGCEFEALRPLLGRPDIGSVVDSYKACFNLYDGWMKREPLWRNSGAVWCIVEDLPMFRLIVPLCNDGIGIGPLERACDVLRTSFLFNTPRVPPLASLSARIVLFGEIALETKLV